MRERRAAVSESPLIRRTRERLAKQRQQEQDRWTLQPAKLQKSMLRWMLRIVGLIVLLGLMFYRFNGGRVF
jgi:hypothetical protein